MGLQQLGRGVVTRAGGVRLAKELVLLEEADQQLLAHAALGDDVEVSEEDFAAAMAFVNQVGEMAEGANHHPDILIHGWNKVRLTLSTHSEGKVTQADHDLAAGIDGLGVG